MNFLTHYIRIFHQKAVLFLLAKSIRNWTLYFAAWLDNPVNHYRMESAVSDNRPLRGEPEDLIYLRQQSCFMLANSMKSACVFKPTTTP